VKRAALAVAMIIVCVGGLSCHLDDYCLQCGHGDAGGDGMTGDGPGDALDSGTCIPTGDEVCDGKDNDCDGLIDEGVLPMVGQLCPNQVGECAGGVWQCTPTYHCSVSVNRPCSGPNDATCPSGETCAPNDNTTDRLTCSKSPSPEICDGKDNNCNGTTDENDPEGGALCGDIMMGGACRHGVKHCLPTTPGNPATDTIQCIGYIGPTAETCDGQDNDCDGMIDEFADIGSLGPCQGKVCSGGSNPGVVCTTNADCMGGSCVGPFGPCKQGTLVCQSGNVVCMGATNPTFETCNGIDDDCDGSIDEDFNTNTDVNNCGACGNVCGAGLPNNGNAVWACQAGTCQIASCNAGYHDNNNSPTDGCEFGVCFFSGAEVCDGVDNDCDGVIDEKTAIGAPPGICATEGECAGTVATCPCQDKPDSMGCATPSGWVCIYGPNVSKDANGNIIPETKCDGLDNDCNGIIDDAQPEVRHADCGTYPSCPFTGATCNNGQTGVCARAGNFVCDAANPTGPAVCNAPDGSGSKTTETCNNLDDDCDGIIDNGSSTGNMPGQEWVAIGGGHQMMKYEASRPDALTNNNASTRTCNTVAITTTSEAGSTATYTTSAAHGFTAGTVVIVAGVGVNGYNGTLLIVTAPTATTFTAKLGTTGLAASSGGTASTNCIATCSTTGRLPWTDVTYLQALGACQAVGATLCSESAWHRACSAVSASQFPISVNGANTSGTLIEAEDYAGIAFATSGGVTRSWVEDETPGFSGISNMIAAPSGNVAIGAANGAAPRLDYTVTFPTAGTYRVFVHMFANNNNGGNFYSAYVGFGATTPANPTLTFKNTATTTWQWIAPASGFVVAAGGSGTISLYMGDGNVKVDAIFVTTNAGTPTFPTNGAGFKWALQPTPNYTANVCNDLNYTGAGNGAPLATGTLASCYANDGAFTGSSNDHAFDMAGNVKEWTLAHQPGQNPVRGGAFNNTANGIDCPLNFTLADDAFFFPDVGFRCCR
jgi:hypothetical protein